MISISAIARIFTIAIVSSSLITAPLASAALPSPFEIELKLATKVKLGQAVSMAVPKCKIVKQKSKFVTKCSYEKFVVTINSFTFKDIRTPIDVETASFAIDLKMENYSSRDTGIDVGMLLRCKSSRDRSSFYSDGFDPQSIPAGSEDAGIVISSFPDEIALEKCQMPTLWISLTNSEVNLKDKTMVAEMKKKKLIGVAYIPLTPVLLAKP